jgi:hypothetical protein
VGRGARANAGTDADISHVFDAQCARAGTGEFDRQVGDLLCRLHPPDGTHRNGLAALLHHRAAGVGDVLRDDVGHLTHGEAHACELCGIGHDHDLLVVATGSIDLRDAGHSAQRGLHDIILCQLEFTQSVHRISRGILEPLFIADRVVVNFTEARGDGGEFRCDARRQLIQNGLEALTRKLAGAIDVRAFLENQGDLRKAEFRDRADFEEFFDSTHLDFDGIGDEFFDFLRCE